MKVWICIVSPMESIRDFVGSRKTGIVPAEFFDARKFGGRTLRVRVSTFVPDVSPPSQEAVEGFILEQVADEDSVIVVYDEVWMHLIENLRVSCFCVPLGNINERSNLQNHFHKLMATALKNWWQVKQRFLESKDIKLLSLPMRNFQADELLELANAVRAAQPELTNAMQAGLKRLRARLRPRKRSARKTVYSVDDAKRFYIYGHEKHSLPETGGGHGSSCAINAQFRFGCRIDGERHYNVSESEGDRTTISGNFVNCHDTENHEKRDTHLNMFASDMYY